LTNPVTVSELLRIADHLEPKDREIVRKAYERAAIAASTACQARIT
jgi:hypothetical protein